MDNKKNEEMKKKDEKTVKGNDSSDVITVVDDYDDFQSMVKDEKEKKAEKAAGKKDEPKTEKAADKKDEPKLEEEKPPYTVNNVKPSGAKKGFLIGISVLAGLLIIAYAAGFFYFSNHFYQDVTANGLNVSGMNSDDARNILDTFYDNYKLTVKTIDLNEYIIYGKDIDSNITIKDSFNDLFKKQEPYLWFVNMFEHHDFDINADATYDADKLNEVLSDFDFLQEKNMESPVDAYIGVENDEFKIIKEVLGTTIDREKFDKALDESLRTVQAQLDLKSSDCYVLPKIYSDNDELVKEYEGKKEYAQYVIKIQMDDLTLEPGMDLYDAVLEKNGDSYQISKTKVEKYVSDLASEYDTMDKDRKFTTSFNGRVITTTGSAFGYELNKEETADALYKALTAGKSGTVDAVFVSKGKTMQGENDIGDTYVEVNLSEQRVIAYKNGRKFAEGDCVSGNESAGHGTTTGLYQVQDKLSPTVLRGEKKAVTKTVKKKNKNGKKVEKTKTTYEYEYESPVTYWLQFNGGQGLHDAAGWRSAYGGSIYYYSGSHGCVNLPLDLAKKLYENIQVGDPVIVYFWDNENRK